MLKIVSKIFLFTLILAGITTATLSPQALLKSSSKKSLLKTAKDNQWSIKYHQQARKDTIHIRAIRVEFALDTLGITTGTGLFSFRGASKKPDIDERNWHNDTTYKFDKLPHDSAYFNNQLEAAASYFRKVSNGNLTITYSLFPQGNIEGGYAVSNTMNFYSPTKKSKDTYDQYYYKKTLGLLTFIKDALKESSSNAQNSPFADIWIDNNGIFRNKDSVKTVFLIFHAGSSYLTDGDQDSESDMIDAFINQDWLKTFKDTLKLNRLGFDVRGKDSSLTIDEIMLCSETSNQDQINWGIQGILVNQIARQIGIPDLYSTSSGVSAIGAFCIMDFAGYSAANGFIPPYPSAWVRAFMGWDKPQLVDLTKSSKYKIRALCSNYDSSFVNKTDPTTLMVTINDHEYYLIENRQRNLQRNDSTFKYDTLKKDHGIREYPDNVNLDSNVITNGKFKVIKSVINNDVGLPASGVLVWHVDEQIIRDRMRYNLVNADSMFRGISLVEADGINDLGMVFYNFFSSEVFDYGGAEDVFPHRRIGTDKAKDTTITGFGPFTKPNTRSTDGGNTFLKFEISKRPTASIEKNLRLGRGGYGDYLVENYCDTIFDLSITRDFILPGWPKQVLPEKFYDPVICDLDKGSPGQELCVVSKSGRLYVWTSDSNSQLLNPVKKGLLPTLDYESKITNLIDTIEFTDSIQGIVAMPSVIGSSVMIPTLNNQIYVLSSAAPTSVSSEMVSLTGTPSTYVCGYQDSLWALGCNNGQVILGKRNTTTSKISLKTNARVSALAAIKDKNYDLAIIQDDGNLTLCKTSTETKSEPVLIKNGIAPYSLVTGDLDRDSIAEIVVCDSRHGLWVYKTTLQLSLGWTDEPNDIALYYRSAQNVDELSNRNLAPENTSAPSLADLNRDGYLDIVLGGTNGIYALNYKGALLNKWPSFLDNRFWYQRKSVISSPVIVTGADKKPLVLFSSPTGQNATFRTTKIIEANKDKGMVWFTNEDGQKDSIWNLSTGLIDTMLRFGDSLVFPFITPGGFIDGIDSIGKRPSAPVSLYSGIKKESCWPLNTGSVMGTSPLACKFNNNNAMDLIGVAEGGLVYAWEPKFDILPDSLFWPQTGGNNQRTFAYVGEFTPIINKQKEPLLFHSYPNPVYIQQGVSSVNFKYQFSAPAKNVRLDIFTMTGFHVFSLNKMGLPPYQLTGSSPDWNEVIVSLKDFGPAVYRCRMEAIVNGKKEVKYWKMAVIK